MEYHHHIHQQHRSLHHVHHRDRGGSSSSDKMDWDEGDEEGGGGGGGGGISMISRDGITSESSSSPKSNKLMFGRLINTTTSTTSSTSSSCLPISLIRSNNKEEEAQALVIEESAESDQDQPTDLSNPHKKKPITPTSSSSSSRLASVSSGPSAQTQQQLPTKQHLRKQKPIPPPLDLSINLGPHLHHGQQQASPFSPKFSQSDKSLPLRKRWHSWSPVPMNGSDESPSIVPLFGDGGGGGNGGSNNSGSGGSSNSSSSSSKTGLGLVEGAVVVSSSQNQYHHIHHHLSHLPHLPSYSGGDQGSSSSYAPNRWLEFVPIATPTTTSSSSKLSNNNNAHDGGHVNGHHAHSGTNSSGDLQTPTPFYTPNEPSPKFMNSPVFSYSNPDTSLYQGPFSPIRASLYPPPSSPFTNLSLNSPHLPSSSSNNLGGGNNQQQQHHHQTSVSTPISSTSSTSSSSSSSSSSCFNMVPSTLLSPAPSQASTNSLSYEDLQEKSLNFLVPAWSIFMPGTKIRFDTGMNSMDWYPVDFLAQSGGSLGLKGEYAPHGLEVRKFVVTCSAKERIQVTFSPVGEPNHPAIEVNCEPGHPFLVEKKGWSAVKPEVFQEIYGTGCQPLECGDVCIPQASSSQGGHHHVARSPNQNQSSSSSTSSSSQYQQQQLHQTHASLFGGANHHSNNIHHHGLQVLKSSERSIIKVEQMMDESQKSISIPISILPQQQTSSSSSHLHLVHNVVNVSHLNNGIISQASSSSLMGSPATMSVGGLIHRSKQFSRPGGSTGIQKKAKEGKAKRASGGTANENKGRRPMNGFLLFAKDKRPELIQMYPGKDNRSISVLLGEAWQSLAPTEREKYSSNAKARAEEQKRIHPDCWKRKRSQSINLNSS